MLIRFDDAFDALAADYLESAGFVASETDEVYLKTGIIFIIEDYLTSMGIDCTVSGYVMLRHFEPHGDLGRVVKGITPNEWGSLGRGFVKEWLKDFYPVLSRTCNRTKSKRAVLRISGNIGVRISWQS